VELMVAMALGLVIVSIGLASLVFSRQGFSAVDNTTQLRDRERFAVDLITRLIIQAGYQDLSSTSSVTRAIAGVTGVDAEPDVYGWNNAFYGVPANKILSEITNISSGDRPGKCTATDTSCRNGSDLLAIRFQGVSTTTGGVVADNTMINCAGRGEPASVTGDLNDRAASLIHVSRGADGEPSLSCVYYTDAGAWSASSPIIEGVESFQILLGTDGVTPNSAAVTAQDSIAERWLRPDQLAVAGNAVATRENWRRVRAVRVGMVLRGPVGSAPDAFSETFRPLGASFTSTADTGSSLTGANAGSAFTAGTDRRLRVTSNFTVHLRNELALK
jgi:type IV pilus assembly protein PilW